MKHLIVIEGPAGSGKSTLIERVVTQGLVHRPHFICEIPRPRKYEGMTGVLLAQLKDYANALGFLANVEHITHGELEAKPTIVDRWVVSQFVYETIRRRPAGQQIVTIPGPLMFQALVHNIQGLFHMHEELRVRDQQIPKLVESPIIDFLILMPYGGLLNDLRRKAGRPFPFNPVEEFMGYQEATWCLQEYAQSPEIRSMANVRVTPFALTSLEDYERVYQTVCSLSSARCPAEVVS